MAYSKPQAKKLASQIHSRFGQKIASATKGTPVPPEFIAGLIGVEAGKDRNGLIKESATRFEPHVFTKLKAVRDGYQLQYNKIRTAQLKDASDAALKALATSYGVTQVMGWWTVRLGGTVADLRNSDKHLEYTVKLLLLNSRGDFERGEYAGEFRQWNTGSETGRTYHEDYVANAGAVMDAYRELLKTETFVTGEVTERPEPASSSVVKDLEEPAKVEKKPEPTKPESLPSPAPDVVVTAEKPNDADLTKDKAPASGITSNIAYIITLLTTAGGGVLSWAQGASTQIVFGFFGGAATVGCVYVVTRFWYRNQQDKRATHAQLEREKMAHELTVLKIKSAMDKNANTVEIAK